MRKFRFLIVAIIVFLLSGCGAEVKYNMNVDTEQTSIALNINMEIDESDYEYIEGGRTRLISIINESKPESLSFSIDEKNENLYMFTLSFSSYEEYLEKYKEITGVESKSIFNIVDFSDTSPFIASKHIELNDDLSKLMDWLKNKLIDIGVVTQNNKNKLVQSQQYTYTFNEEKSSSYNKVYDEKSIVEVLQTDINLLIKKDNKMDLLLSIYINEEDSLTFTENFFVFLENKEMNFEYNNSALELDGIKCIKYDIKLTSLDLNNIETIDQINNVFGDNFLSLTDSTVIESGNFIKQDYYQSLKLNLSFSNLFNRKVIDPVKIDIDLEDIKIDESKTGNTILNTPFSTTELNSNGIFKLNLNTTYSTINYLLIIFLSTVLILALIVVRKCGFNNIYNQFSSLLKNLKSRVLELVKNKIFSKEFKLKNSLIIGENYIIQVQNISKIDYGKRSELYAIIIIWILSLVGVLILYEFVSWLLFLLIFIATIVILVIYSIINRTNVLFMQLTSGKVYMFYFENEVLAKEIYNQLLNSIEENLNDELPEFIGEILEKVEEEKNEKI